MELSHISKFNEDNLPKNLYITHESNCYEKDADLSLMSEYLQAFEYYRLSIRDILPCGNLLTTPGFYRMVWVYFNISTSTLPNILSNTLIDAVFFKHLAKWPW